MNVLLDVMDWAMTKWRKFSAFDAAVFKLCLFSMGTLFGMNAAKNHKKYAPFFQITALLTFSRLVWKLFLSDS